MSKVGNWQGPKIVKEGLVLYLDAGSPNSFFNKTSTTWRDISGYGNNATLMNGVTYSSNNGGVFVFDGTDDAAKVSPNAIYRNFTNATFSIWCTFSTLSTNSIYTLINNGVQSTDSHFWLYYDNRTSLPSNVNRIGFEWGNGTARTGLLSTSTLIPVLNNWYNIVATFDNGTSIIYVNGVVFGSGTTLVTTITGVAAAQIYTGGYFSAGPSGIQLSWPGNLNQHLIYRKTLSQSEVLQNYNVTKYRYL